MRLHEALDAAFGTNMAISRPYLMDDRNCYLTYEEEHLPLKQRWLHSPSLSADWHPSPVELMADDWVLVSDPRVPTGA